MRRAWLWGEDRVSGRNYEHRKNWVVARLAELAEVFTLDVCAYAVMSNYYHLVVRLDVEKAHALSEDEVIARYSRLFKVPLLVERYLDGLTSEAENLVARKILGQWRERLCDLSWYMRGLNNYLARRANAENGCKGRFWTVERIRRLQPQPVSAPQESEECVSSEAASVQSSFVLYKGVRIRWILFLRQPPAVRIPSALQAVGGFLL